MDSTKSWWLLEELPQRASAGVVAVEGADEFIHCARQHCLHVEIDVTRSVDEVGPASQDRSGY